MGREVGGLGGCVVVHCAIVTDSSLRLCMGTANAVGFRDVFDDSWVTPDREQDFLPQDFDLPPSSIVIEAENECISETVTLAQRDEKLSVRYWPFRKELDADGGRSGLIEWQHFGFMRGCSTIDADVELVQQIFGAWED
ncbi:hypothetical protein EVAR_53837_1 [Eumeta japonica]|uniref:Uncharacterized protein n=1 Tax=Eumeta variegata TaxID=151549 RepID=A0A4C1ZIW5_EUMVA|nr:hypothetical protein EVAR_53837_1 [Eumeta japonica]